MLPNSISARVLLVLMCAISPVCSWAVPIYDNLSGFDSGNALIVGPTGGNDYVQGFQFTAQISSFVGSIEAPVGWWGAPAAIDITFGLYTSNSGVLGSLLEEINVVASGYGGNPNVEMGLASGGTYLQAGLDYWLLAESEEFGGWNLHHRGESLRRATSMDGGATFEYDFGPLPYFKGNTSAFRVNAVEVPTPATYLLMLLGFALIVGMRMSQTGSSNFSYISTARCTHTNE